MIPPEAWLVLAPINGHATRDVQNLSGTTSQAIGTALPVGAYATAIFEVDVRLAFGAAAQTATTSDCYWPAKVPFSWQVEEETQFISAIHNDGSTQFDGSVWQSSPGM